jgi:hypothetical protein
MEKKFLVTITVANLCLLAYHKQAENNIFVATTMCTAFKQREHTFFFIFISPCAIIIKHVSQSCNNTQFYVQKVILKNHAPCIKILVHPTRFGIICLPSSGM